MSRTFLPTMRLTHLLLASALMALTAPAAPAVSAPIQGSGVSARGATGAVLVARDARIAFDRRSASFARTDLDDLEPGDHGRIAALLATGASGSVNTRARLVAETAPSGLTEERVAAAYALGELGPRVGQALETLIQLSADESRAMAEAAMVALVRSGLPDGRSRVARIAGGTDVRAGVARSILAHQADPTRSDPPMPYRQLYSHRWDAARSYGTIDGKVWGASLLVELAQDRVFLEALVLQLARDLKLENAKDHLLEILFEGEGAHRIITAVQMMPYEVEALIDAGVWRPADWNEWRWLITTVLNEELQSSYPRSITLALEQPVTQAMAAGLLQGGSDRYEEILFKAFEDEDPRTRAHAAFAVGASHATDFIPRLNELCDDPAPWTRANAIGALIRMGSQKGVERAIDVLVVPPDDREPRISSYLFEVLARAAPDGGIMRFVEELAPRLSGADRASVDSILLLNGVVVDTATLRRELPLMDPTTPEAVRGIRALGLRPSSKDRRLLVRLFPRDGARTTNLELAAALARAGHRTAEPLLQAAIWELELDLSILAAGVVRRTYGEPTLMAWAITPPASVSDEDVRRLGFAIGEWGGMAAVEGLRKQLGTTGGAELPALQGAVFGALASRTR